MRNKKRIEILENILWDLLRTLHFNGDRLNKQRIKGYRNYMEDNLPHIRKRLKRKHTRTLTRYTRG